MGDQFLQAVFDHILGRDVVKKLMQVMYSLWNVQILYCAEVSYRHFLILFHHFSYLLQLNWLSWVIQLKGLYINTYKSLITKTSDMEVYKSSEYYTDTENTVAIH